MDDKIKNQLRIDRIRNMKNPTIVMNDIDFGLLKIESKYNCPTYLGLPIMSHNYIEKGILIIYDDIRKYK